jgi:hypothetical protein
MGKFSSDPPNNLMGKFPPLDEPENSVEAALLYPQPNNNDSFSSHSSGSEVTD